MNQAEGRASGEVRGEPARPARDLAYRIMMRIGEMLKGMGTTIDSALERKGDSTTASETQIDENPVSTARVKEG